MDPTTLTELSVVQVSFMQWVCRCDAACAGSRPNRACFSVPGQENPPVLPSYPSPTWWCSASREPKIENPVRPTRLDLSYCTDLLCTFNNKKTTKQVDVTMFCIFTYCKKILNASDCPLPHNQTTKLVVKRLWAEEEPSELYATVGKFPTPLHPPWNQVEDSMIRKNNVYWQKT